MQRRTLISGAVSLGLLGAAEQAFGQTGATRIIERAAAEPDYILLNGQFIDYRGRVGSAIAIGNGRILAVGDAVTRRPDTPAVDLGGRTVIPGLIDAHAHFTRAGINPGHQERRVERAFSIAELQQVIARRAATVPRGELITCIGGWNHNQFAERRRPTPAELDEAAPDHAVYLSATGGGTGAITNSRGRAFFEAQGIAVDADTGRVEAAQDALAALRAIQTDADRLRGTAELNAYAASMGLTTVINAGNLEDQGFPLSLWREGKLDVRMRPLYSADSPDDVRTWADGSFGQNGRAVGDELYRPAGFGERVGGFDTMSDRFEPTARAVAGRGWLLQQHSISARENEFHVAAFERIAAGFDLAPLHWALIHLQEIPDEVLRRLGAIGAGASAQTWTYLSTAGGPPFRRIVDSGLPAAVGTDSTNVSALDPWLTLFYMTTGRNLAGELTNDGQQISRLEALRLYTRGAAWFSLDDETLGSFETGRLADLAVLSADYLTAPDEALRRIESSLTLVGGRVVHAAAPFD
jgi:predicted amidohydrolase YtcJ